MTTNQISVTVLSTDDVTVAQVISDDVSATGSAKLHPNDEFVPQIGKDLALARALASLSEKFAERAALSTGGPVEVGGYEYEPEKPDFVSDLTTMMEKLGAIETFDPSIYTNPFLDSYRYIVNNYGLNPYTGITKA